MDMGIGPCLFGQNWHARYLFRLLLPVVFSLDLAILFLLRLLIGKPGTAARALFGSLQDQKMFASLQRQFEDEVDEATGNVRLWTVTDGALAHTASTLIAVGARLKS